MDNPQVEQQLRDMEQTLHRQRWDFYPPLASELGLHEYDGLLPDLSPGSVRRRLEEVHRGLDQLQSIQRRDLSPQGRMDLGQLELALQREQFELAEMRSLERDPMSNLGYLSVTNYVQRNYAPLEERLRSATKILSQVPEFLEVAARNLAQELARPILEASIESYQGMARFYREDLPRAAEDVSDRSVLEPFHGARETAARAVEGFADGLKARLEGSSADFAIGPDLYLGMLKYGEMVDLPLSRLLQVGQQDLERNLEALEEAARRLDPSRSPRELVEHIALDHPTAQSLIPEAGRLLEDIREFIARRDIISLPSQDRCQVQETPSFMRWAFAAMDTPGLLERQATEAYYYVTPVEESWTEQQAEEWLSDFNYQTIQIVSIHEVYPGHFLQSLHARGAPSLTSKANSSYSFSEGWAHYTEEMMLDEGYGQNNGALKLAQICDALLRDCRYLCAIGMHTQGMSVDEATRTFVDKAFMSEFPARKEAMRGTFDPGYLNYTLGKLMILKLREDYRREQGAFFSTRAFHDRLLSYGTPPVPLLREAMLKDPSGLAL